VTAYADTCPGVLLTGGTSRRMGVDKATMMVNGEILAARGARALSAVCDPVIEVGPGVTGLRHVREDPVGAGPLAAFLAGFDALRWGGPTVLLACDLPLAGAAVVERLVYDARAGSIVPVVDGRAQYACARWSEAAIAAGRDALASGSRALGALAVDVEEMTDPTFTMLLADVDTVDDLHRLGLSYDAPQ
jgi:molybdopterin-guanine dinucleotide biosynthesis protein A